MRVFETFHSSKRKNVIAQLSGGLGNQLFQYYTGYVIAAQSRRELVLDDFRTREGSHYKNRVKAKMSVRGLRGLVGFHGHYLSDTLLNRTLSRNIFATRLPFYKKRLAVFDYSPHGERGVDLTVQDINVSDRHEKNIRIRGNLQSKQIVTAAIELGATSSLTVSELSKVAERLIQKVITDKPIGIHLRLLDLGAVFSKLPLGVEYYEESINKIRCEIPDSPIWLFTDDIELAKKLLPQTFVQEISAIVDPYSLSDVETLLIMSMCEGLVLTNSTFSFWAGFFSKSNLVIAPSEFLWN